MPVTPGDATPPSLDRTRLLSLRNGEKLTPTFSCEEMNRRLSKLRSWMEQASIDACLFTSIHNVNYFADYVYCSFGRHYGLVVTHDAHTIIGANLDYGRPWRRSIADNLAYTDWRRDNFFVAVRSPVSRPRPDRHRARSRHLRSASGARNGVAKLGARRCRGSDDAYANGQVRRGARVDPRRRCDRRYRRRRGCRGDNRACARA